MNWCSILALLCLAIVIQGEEDQCLEQLKCTCIKIKPECKIGCDKDKTWCKWMPLTECSNEALQKECPERCHDETTTLPFDYSSTPDYFTTSEVPSSNASFLYCGVDFNLSGPIDSLSSEQRSELLPKVSQLPDYCDEPISPPFGRSAEDIEFRLYDRITKDDYRRLITNEPSSVDSPFFNPSLPLLVVAHGWMEDVDSPAAKWMHDIKDQWMEKKQINVILVQWKKLASTSNYPVAANNAKFVGTELAALLNFLKKYIGLSLSKTHLIGFSLGAQVTGAAGHNLENLARITGLDPAGRLFNGAPLNDKLDASDASFVDIIHTNKGGLGSINPCGHVDFNMNGGYLQNECEKPHGNSTISLCSHHQAHVYYIMSLKDPEPRYGYLCENQKIFQGGLCLNNANNTVGYGVKPNPTGVFYSNTQ